MNATIIQPACPLAPSRGDARGPGRSTGGTTTARGCRPTSGVRRRGRPAQIAATGAFRVAFRAGPRAGGRTETGRGPRPPRRPSARQSSRGIQPCSVRNPGPHPARSGEKTPSKTIWHDRCLLLVSLAGPTPGSRHTFEVGPPTFIPAAGCHAPDPCGHDRALLSGSEAPLLFGFRPVERPRNGLGPMERPAAAATAFLPRSVGFRPGVTATLDCGGRRALLCGFLGSLDAAACRDPRASPAGPA